MRSALLLWPSRRSRGVLRHKSPKHRCGLRIAAGAATAAATAVQRNIQRCTALFVLLVEPGALTGDVLDDRRGTSCSRIVQDSLAAGVESVHVDPMFNQQLDGFDRA